MVVKNTRGSHECFVQFSRSVRIMLRRTRRFKEIASSQSWALVCACVCSRAIVQFAHIAQKQLQRQRYDGVDCFDMHSIDFLLFFLTY